MAIKHKAFKFRLYPNLEQANKINQTIGCSRLVYNQFLDFKIYDYKNNKTSNSYNTCSKLLTKLKVSLPFLKEVDKFALQNSLKHLNSSYENFFKNGFGFPNFKSKHNKVNSYTTNFTNNNIKVTDKFIQLPKVGKVKYRGYKNNNISEFKIISATVSKNNLNQYYCSICCEVVISTLPTLTKEIGIDLGVKTFATCSDGKIISNLRTLAKYEKRLKKQQRKLSKKEKGSKNREKQRLILAKIHQKIANIREDFLQKETTKIISENQVICIEDLSVKNMMSRKNSLKNMAKELSNVSLNRFVNILTYKSDWYGRTLVKVDKYYPSSQLCNNCGYKNTTLNINDREWICPSCKSKLDRDYNASLNILAEGRRIVHSS